MMAHIVTSTEDGTVYDRTSRSANNSVHSEEMRMEEEEEEEDEEMVDPNDEYDPDSHGVHSAAIVCSHKLCIYRMRYYRHRCRCHHEPFINVISVIRYSFPLKVIFEFYLN